MDVIGQLHSTLTLVASGEYQQLHFLTLRYVCMYACWRTMQRTASCWRVCTVLYSSIRGKQRRRADSFDFLVQLQVLGSTKWFDVFKGTTGLVY